MSWAFESNANLDQGVNVLCKQHSSTNNSFQRQLKEWTSAYKNSVQDEPCVNVNINFVIIFLVFKKVLYYFPLLIPAPGRE